MTNEPVRTEDLDIRFSCNEFRIKLRIIHGWSLCLAVSLAYIAILRGEAITLRSSRI